MYWTNIKFAKYYEVFTSNPHLAYIIITLCKIYGGLKKDRLK